MAAALDITPVDLLRCMIKLVPGEMLCPAISLSTTFMVALKPSWQAFATRPFTLGCRGWSRITVHSVVAFHRPHELFDVPPNRTTHAHIDMPSPRFARNGEVAEPHGLGRLAALAMG